ncbi:hypothetical protein ACFLVI_04090 [Chloroflexota bacterium]
MNRVKRCLSFPLLVVILLTGCGGGIESTTPTLTPTPSKTLPTITPTTMPIATPTPTDAPTPIASVIIDSIVVKQRAEVRHYGNVADGYVYDIEAYGHASGPVGSVMWTTINAPAPIEYNDRKIQAPNWTAIENSAFERSIDQPESTSWVAIYPGFEVQADEFDGWNNVLDISVRMQQGLYGTVLASETKTVTCLLSPSEN